VWDEYGSEVEELIDAGNHVIAVIRSWGRGKQSEAAVETGEHHVWTLRDGKLWRLRVYPDEAEALEAVGLWE
jgi:ketosteroid isomerase-like protein